MKYLNNLGLPGLGVNLDDLPSRIFVEVNLVAVAILCPMCRIVIDTDDLLLAILRLGDKPSVMLKCKFDLWSHFEAGGFSRKLPHNFASFAVDLIGRIGITSGDKIIACLESIVDRRAGIEYLPSASLSTELI